jgi:predicted ArsR family transcriptional regulator
MSSPDRSLRIRLRDVAETVGITERAAQRIVTDLVESGFLERERRGRRNRYLINEKTEMRHPAQEGYEIGELLDLLRHVRDSRDRRQAAHRPLRDERVRGLRRRPRSVTRA